MGSFLTDIQKSQANSLMDDLHDTFKENITIINEIANAVIIDDQNYNAFSDRKDSNITYTATSQIISARVKYLDKADAENELIFKGGAGTNGGGSSIFLDQRYGIVRVKIEKQYVDLVLNATKILVGEQECQLLFNYSPHTLFGNNYSIIYLSRQI